MKKKKTIYDFVEHCMKDEEFNRGGIPTKEKEFFKSIGLKYDIEEDGTILVSDDVRKFYDAMCMLSWLNDKYF